MLTPVLEKAVNGMDGAVKLVKVNVDENPEVSRQHKVCNPSSMLLDKLACDCGLHVSIGKT
jgi:hypothetical protein